MFDEGPEASHQLFSWRQVFFQPHPGARPVVQIAAVDGSSEDDAERARRFTLEVFALKIVLAMELLTILNQCHHHRGFVYQHARFGADKKSIEVDVRPRLDSAAVCSGCHRPAPGYDHLPERGFEFIPLWGFLVFLLYLMRRVDCRDCGVVVEEVPLERWQAPVDPSLYAVSGPLGAQALLEGNRRVVPHFLGQGVRCG
jgi:hypothetical protein